MGDRCEVPVRRYLIRFFKLDLFFYFVWPLKAIFLCSFYVKAAEQTGSQEILEYSFYTSNEVFVLCQIMPLSVISHRVGRGAGYLREIDSENLSVGRDFDT